MRKSNSEYGFYRVAAVSPELRIANTEFNSNEICNVIENTDADLIVFPELSITSYSCQDLFYQKQLLDSSISDLNKICKASETKKNVVIVGMPIKSSNRLFNSAVVINNGSIVGIVPKSYLCNTNEYYEERWFASEFDRIEDFVNINGKSVPFGTNLIFENKNDDRFRLAVEICEDMWAPIPPSAEAAISGATIIANLSASNEYLGKSEYRESTVKMQSGRQFSVYIYAASGIWESSSDTVFSGKSMIYENAQLLSKTIPFSFGTELCVADIDVDRLVNERLKNNTFSGSKSSKKFRTIELDMPKKQYPNLLRKNSPTPFVPSDENLRSEVCSDINDLQVSGLARRLMHTGMKNVVIGISGGLDSTLALLVVYNAFNKIGLDKKGIHAITMPGFGTTKRTKNNAVSLAEKLGIDYKEISISKSTLIHFEDIAHNKDVHNVVFENAQARRRTHILMDIANQVNGIVIGTGDLSESALGWCTYNGDHMSMYGVNSGVPKTLVKYMVEWYAKSVFSLDISEILYDIINTPISPELLPPDSQGDIAQKTESSIGPYILHDFFLYYALRHAFKSDKILFLAEIAFENTYDRNYLTKVLNEFYKRFFNNQFKRNAVPDGPKVGTVSLSQRADWRMPSDADSKIWLVE